MNSTIRSRMLGALYAGTMSMGLSLSASAAFVFSGGSTQSLPLSGNDFNTDLATLNFDQITSGTQLRVNQDGFVDFFYVGAESGFTNTFTSGGNSATEGNEGFKFSGYASFTTAVSAGDILDFSFTSANRSALTPVDNFNNTNLQGLGIIFDSNTSGSLMQVVLGYDDQITGDDNDHDDMLIRADFRPAPASVAAVPVPAAVYLFGSGLLGLTAITFRKQKLV
jgi:hypothetical protein